MLQATTIVIGKGKIIKMIAKPCLAEVIDRTKRFNSSGEHILNANCEMDNIKYIQIATYFYNYEIY